MRIGHAVSPDDMIITSGCTEAVALALSSVARPGDTIAVESPTYFGLLHTLEVLGLKALELPMDPSHGVNIDALARLLAAEPVAACMLSSSFSNPLGSLMPEAGKREVLALLARHKVPLIEDDVYGEIHFTRQRPRPFVALDGGANVIYCSSFSKCLAPGYRIGWIAPGLFAQKVMDRKLAHSLSGPVLPQVAMAEFLASGAFDAHLRRLRRRLEENLLCLARAIEASFPAETRVSRPAGGFSLVGRNAAEVRLPRPVRRCYRRWHLLRAGGRLLRKPKIPELPAPECGQHLERTDRERSSAPGPARSSATFCLAPLLEPLANTSLSLQVLRYGMRDSAYQSQELGVCSEAPNLDKSMTGAGRMHQEGPCGSSPFAVPSNQSPRPAAAISAPELQPRFGAMHRSLERAFKALLAPLGNRDRTVKSLTVVDNPATASTRVSSH